MQIEWTQKYAMCTAIRTAYAWLTSVVLPVKKRFPNKHLNYAYPNGQT